MRRSVLTSLTMVSLAMIVVPCSAQQPSPAGAPRAHPVAAIRQDDCPKVIAEINAPTNVRFDPTAASAPGIVVGRAQTRVDWQSPGLTLSIKGPDALAVNQEGTYTITLTNPGQVAVRSATVRQPVPAGSEYVRSEPPAIVEGKELIWTLGELPGGTSRDLKVVMRQRQPVRLHRLPGRTERAADRSDPVIAHAEIATHRRAAGAPESPRECWGAGS